MTDKKILAKFKDVPVQPKIIKYKALGRQINYVEVGDDTLPMVVFIHGAPGSLADFMYFLKDSTLISKCRLISVDRPGYGNSDYGKVETSLERQAAMIKPILDKNKNSKPPILVGHSFGGPVVARMAMDYPKLVGAMILAAPAIDPDNEKIFWISYPIDWWVIKWAMPKVIRVTNDEKLSHVEELEKMLPLWEKVKTPTVFIHGHKDMLVPFANSEFGVNMLSNAQVSTIFEKKMNHLIPWNRPEVIKAAIIKCLEEE